MRRGQQAMCADHAGRVPLRRMPKVGLRSKWGVKNLSRPAPHSESELLEANRLSHGEILGALRALVRGEPSVRLPDHMGGLDGQVAGTFNKLAQLHMDLEEQFRVLRQAIGNE